MELSKKLVRRSRRPSPPAVPRLSARAAFALIAAIIGLALFAPGTPSPLYGTNRVLWASRRSSVTLVYATYAFGVLAALILASPGASPTRWGGGRCSSSP